ncbi:MAG: 30S ribosomal protein S18 [Thermoleophilia bacterium]|jgi:small subunit ribosomal protein S18|nr:30S ribosomal protein S18 [Thermoleophilia bacterium]
MATTTARPRRAKTASDGTVTRRPCPFCEAAIEEVDFKDPATLRRFVTGKGRIRARHATGVCRRHQMQVAAAVKRAREMALLPQVNS